MEYEIQKHLHYAGIPSFNLYPYTQDTECADITIMGVPFDSGVTNRPGARLGPRAIRNMSQLTNCFAYPWSYKLSDKAKIVDYGDVGYYVGANTMKVMLEETYNTAKKVFESGSKLLTLGGDPPSPPSIRKPPYLRWLSFLYTIFTRLFLYTKTKTAASDHSETAEILPT